METYDIPGNNRYLITDKKELIRRDGEPLDLKMANDKVQISLYGKIGEVTVEWLYWLAYFKLELPKTYVDKIFDYRFIPSNILIHMRVDPVIVVFDKPVYIKDNDSYRLIARFPNYAIAAYGTVHNLKTNTYNKPTGRTSAYMRASIVDQAGKYNAKEQSTHRLVALTWVVNTDYAKYCIVDHRDGDKSNCHYSNLKWVDYHGNNKAAVNTGLRTDNYVVITRNIDTDEIREHQSLTDASVYMGRSRINTVHTPLKPNLIWRGKNGRFELKKKSDTSAWYYIDKDMPVNSSATQTITITKQDGSKIVYNKLMDFINKELGYLRRVSTLRAVNEYTKRYPENSITVFSVITDTGVNAGRRLSDSKVVTCNTEYGLVTLTGLSKSTINKYLKLGPTYNAGGWCFVNNYKSDYVWPNVCNKAQNIAKNIRVVNEENGSTETFASLRATGNALKVDKKTIKRVIQDKNLLFNKYRICYI